MKLPLLSLSIGVVLSTGIVTLGQSSNANETAFSAATLNRRAAKCFTMADYAEPNGCLLIENVSVERILLESLAFKPDSIPYGFVQLSNQDRPLLSVMPSGLTVRDILNALVTADRRYRWTLEDGIINLMPVESQPSLLDVRLVEFKRANVMTASIFHDLESLPEVRERAEDLGMSGPRQFIARFGPVDTRKFSFNCKQCTVREILNSLVRQNGSSWMYSEFRDAGKTFYHFSYASPQ